MHAANAQNYQAAVYATVNPRQALTHQTSIASTPASDEIQAAAKDNGSSDKLWYSFNFQAGVAANIKTRDTS